VLGSADPSTRRATLQVHGNPLVSWIWIGVAVLIFGASISLWPEVSLGRLGAWGAVRASAGVTASVIMAVMLASSMSTTGALLHRTGGRVRSVHQQNDGSSNPGRLSPMETER
jgi:hypothetical protein